MPKKYPSTPHLPFSPWLQSDDIQLSSAGHFLNTPVVITEKLDGGNCQLYLGDVYARTTSKVATHKSFSVVKQLYSGWQYMLQGDVALFGENMEGIHSIEYSELDSYFYLFGILKNQEKFASWDEVKRIAQQLEVPHVPVVFEGEFQTTKQLQSFIEGKMKEKSVFGESPEGFVIRKRGSCQYDEFDKNFAKYVKKDFVQTKKDWVRTWKRAKLIE